MNFELILRSLTLCLFLGMPVIYASTPAFYDRHDYLAVCNGSAQSTAVADLNGDGAPDIICGAAGKVLLGNGDGTFRNGPASTIPGGAGVVGADLNGDGKIDLVFCGAIIGSQGPFGIGVSLGNGDGTFQPEVFYQTDAANNIGSVVLGDFNGDGILDAATETQTGVWLFTGKAGGQFSSGVLVRVAQAGNADFSLSAADMNGDGKLDLVASTQTGFAVLLGNGNGTFKKQINTPEYFQLLASGLTIGDLNGDGHPDVVVVSGLYNYVLVYISSGDGTFVAPKVVSLPGGENIAIGDVNGDRIPDLVSDGVYIALGKGDGTFKAPSYFAVAGPSTTASAAASITLADLRHSGSLDIVAVNGYSTVSVLLNSGYGTYNEGISTAVTGGGAGCPVSMDFNRDGKPDLAICVTQGFSILLGTGNATKPFTQGPVIPLANMGSMLVGDVNGDGIPDILASTFAVRPSSATVTVFLGNGDGTFVQKSVTAVSKLGSIAVGDFNGDGKLDFAMTTNLMAFGNGDGTFQSPVPFVPFINPQTQVDGFINIAAADLNGDGSADVILTDYLGSYIYVLLSKGSGRFQETILNTKTPVFVCGSPFLPVVGDINGDGKPDLLVGCGDGVVPIYLNDGQGNLTFAKSLLTQVIAGGTVPVIADMNGDGIADVTLATNYEAAVFLSSGSLNFDAPFFLGTAGGTSGIITMNAHGQSPLAGKPDIIVTDVSGKVITILNLTH